MYSTSEIQSAARKLSQVEADLKRMENQFTSVVQETVSWWAGPAGEAFKEDYLGKTRNAISGLYAGVRDLELEMNRLAREVQAADDRRRVEAEKQALLLKQQKSKK